MHDDESVFQIHGIDLDPTAFTATVDGESVSLTKVEFKMLHFLARNAGTAFTREQIIEVVQGPDYPATDRTVDVHVAALRKKLGDRGKLIETVRGVGYRFRPPSAP